MGLESFVKLQIFNARNCKKLAKLPNMQMLSNVKVFDLDGCLVKAIQGLDKLIALEEFYVGFDKIKHYELSSSTPTYEDGESRNCKMESKRITLFG